jgi:hypothetical protein
MARKQSTKAKNKAIIKAHEGYKAFRWQCTGRHRHTEYLLSIVLPLACPEGHGFRAPVEIPMKKYLSNTTERKYINEGK